MLGDQGVWARISLVLLECIWKAFLVSLVLGFPPRQVVYPPGYMVPPLVTASRFLAGNREAELLLLTIPAWVILRVGWFIASRVPPCDCLPFPWGE